MPCLPGIGSASGSCYRRHRRQRLTARSSVRRLALILTLMVAIVPVAAAQERSLNQGYPLRLDDAYPIAAGDATLLFDGGVGA